MTKLRREQVGNLTESRSWASHVANLMTWFLFYVQPGVDRGALVRWYISLGPPRVMIGIAICTAIAGTWMLVVGTYSILYVLKVIVLILQCYF